MICFDIFEDMNQREAVGKCEKIIDVTEALVIVTPFDVVKIRLQQQKGRSKDALKYKGPVHCAVLTLREEGIRGLWSGATPTVLRNGESLIN